MPLSPTAISQMVLQEVEQERRRQDAKWGVQSHDNPYWLAILAEEFGEAAEAVLEEDGGRGQLRTELIQVAAVATAWVEDLDRD